MKTASITLSGFDLGWYRYREWGMRLSPELPNWLHNRFNAMQTVDPYHLPSEDRFFFQEWFEATGWVYQFHADPRSLFCFFEVVIALLTVIWGICTALVVLKSCCRDPYVQREEDSQQLGEMVDSMRSAVPDHNILCCDCCYGNTENNANTDQKIKLSSIDGPKQNIQPVTQRAVWKDMTFFMVDFATDLKQIHDLYLGKQNVFGGLSTLVFFCSLTALSKDILELRKESQETVRRGIYSEGYLRTWNFEKGFESALSLLLSAYTSRFAIQTLDSCLSNVFNILMTAYALSEFLQRKVVLARFKVD
eukprot:CAMPEP_0172745524 /NCGR_PEP_ID=MMETSP1074-20121228/138164_1 /TAXON_ID=2916 /ORGANISM="Ceratium fusus, Strain PA161109" /LENGTH=305 /DNA_ID=CAMNT_0013576715 /DNA_START=1 /DNA_END=918 /DNA_ORIENTATION=-